LKELLKLTLIIPLLAALGLFGFFGLPGDPSFAKWLTADSRLDYAFMATICVWLSSFGTAPLILFSLIFDTIFRRNRHV